LQFYSNFTDGGDHYLAAMLVKKLNKAKDGLLTTREAFEQLSACVKDKWQKKWEAEEAKALRRGGEHMSIYEVSMAAGLL